MDKKENAVGAPEEPNREDETPEASSENSEHEYLQAPISKKEQEAFIRDVKATENIIDPGNEHHHTDDDER